MGKKRKKVGTRTERREAVLKKKKLPSRVEAAEREELGLEYTRWSDDIREKCLVHVFKHGTYVSATRKYGVPKTTIFGWVKQALKEEGEVSDLRTACRIRAVARAWRALDRLLGRVEKRLDDTDGTGKSLSGALGRMSDVEMVQAGERLARLLDSLGDIVHHDRLDLGVSDKRRAQHDRLTQWERDNEAIIDAEVRLLPKGDETNA